MFQMDKTKTEQNKKRLKNNQANELVIHYYQLGDILDFFCKSIKMKHNRFCGVHGIPRGGLVMAVHASHYLNIPLINSIEQICELDGDNDPLLIVDDVSDTGETLKQYADYFDKKQTNYFIATFHKKPQTVYVPDLYLCEVPDDQWIVYPWEITRHLLTK